MALLREIDLPKVKPYKSLFYWDSKTQNVAEHNLKQDLDFQVSQYKWKEIENGSYFIGGISDGKRKVGIDLGGALPEANPTNSILLLRFDSDGKIITLQSYDDLNWFSPQPDTLGQMEINFVCAEGTTDI